MNTFLKNVFIGDQILRVINEIIIAYGIIRYDMCTLLIYSMHGYMYELVSKPPEITTQPEIQII